MAKEASNTLAAFIGRRAELYQMKRCLLDCLDDKKPRFVLIEGDFGTGKTALVEQFLYEVAQEGTPLHIGRGQCSDRKATGYLPFTELVANLTESHLRWSTDKRKLIDFAKAIAPAWLDVLLGGIPGALATTVVELQKLAQPSGMAFTTEHVQKQLANCLEKVASDRPTVAFIDDLHWADESSLALLLYLWQHLEECRLLLICTFRGCEALAPGPTSEEFGRIYANLNRYGVISLSLQEGISVADYIAKRYPQNDYPPELAGRVQQVSKGHAMLVNELFSSWEGQRIIQTRREPSGRLTWTMTPGAVQDISIPAKVTAILDDRYRRMDEGLRRILNCAAVEGEEFAAEVTQSVMQVDPLRIFDDLRTLHDQYALVQETGQTRNVGDNILDLYRFSHPYFQEYVYKRLQAGEKRLLHKLIGQHLEKLCANQQVVLGPSAGQLAQHFGQAGLPRKAAGYARVAAQFEQFRNAWAEVQKWCTAGLDWLAELPADDEIRHLQMALLEQSGLGYREAGDMEASAQRYRAALEVAEALPVAPEQLAHLCERFADIIADEGRHDEAREYVAKGKQVLREHATPRGEAGLKLDVLEAYLQQRGGDYAQAIASFEHLLEEVHGRPQDRMMRFLLTQIYNGLGVTWSSMGQYVKSNAAHQKSIAIAKEIGAYRRLLSSLLNLAYDYLDQWNPTESQKLAHEGLAIARQIGDREDEAYATSILGSGLAMLGRPKEGIQLLTEAIELFQQLHATWNLNYSYSDLTHAYLAVGDVDRADDSARRALECAEDMAGEGYAAEVRGAVEAARQNWAAASEHLEKAIELFTEDDSCGEAARTRLSYAQTLLAQGKAAEAIDLLRTALTTFQELGLAPHAAETARRLQAAEEAAARQGAAT